MIRPGDLVRSKHEVLLYTTAYDNWGNSSINRVRSSDIREGSIAMILAINTTQAMVLTTEGRYGWTFSSFFEEVA